MIKAKGFGILTTVVRGHVYVMHYDRERPDRALHAIGQWACNNQLNLGWYEAARLSARVRLKAKCDRVKV